MSRELRVHPEAIRELSQSLRAWRGRWIPQLEAAQRTAWALIQVVRAVPGRGFEMAAEADRVRLVEMGDRVEMLARTLEQALARLETAFHQAARLLQEPSMTSPGTPLPATTVAASFEEAYAFIRKWEGGYVNDPDDRGGATNMGITQTTYNDYRRRHGLPPQDVAQITPGEAEAIYREFWETSGAGKLPRSLGVVHMDTAVNMGPLRAKRFLEEIQRRNPGTPEAAVEMYLDLRLNRYLELAQDPSQRKFLPGWLNRLWDLSYHATGDRAFQRSFEEKASRLLSENPDLAPILEDPRLLWNQTRR